MKCTWFECTEEASHPQVSKDKEVWANLCETHHKKLESALDPFDIKLLVAYWVKAQSGFKAATKRILGN